MIKISKLNDSLYQVDDNELPLENPEIRKLLTSYAGLSDIEANQWLDELEEKKENTFEPKEANKGVIVNIYEVEYPAPQDPNKETQEMAKRLDEYKDFVSQQVFPGSQTEDVVVDLRKNLQPPKQVQKLNWRSLKEVNYDSKNDEGWGFTKDNKVRQEQTYKFGDTYYQFLRPIKSTQLQVGIIYGASYSQFNSGYDLIRFKGFSSSKDASGPEFTSVKEFLRSLGITSLKTLSDADLYLNWRRPSVWNSGRMSEENKAKVEAFFQRYPALLNLDIENDYRMWGDYINEDGTWDNDKDYYYLSEGRWSRGSGAERLTFWEVEEVSAEAPKLDWSQPIRSIEEIQFKDLESKTLNDGIVLLGAGGDPNEWIDGIAEMWNEENIATGAAEELFSGFYKLTSTGGRTDLALPFKEGAKLDMGRMAMWRLKFGECSWISDYLVNYKSHFASKLRWAQLTPMKVLRAVKLRGSWMWTNPNEMVIPEVLTDDHGFYGVDSRKGTQYAIVTSEEIDPMELAKKDVEGFWGKADMSEEKFNKILKGSYNSLVKEKLKYYQIIAKDLKGLKDGTIIEEAQNPSTGPGWYRIVKSATSSLKLDWRDLYEQGNPDDFFKTDKCDRCGSDISKGPRTMSWFNHDTICWECSNKEYEYKKTLPNHGSDLEGKGLPEELTPNGNWRNKLNWDMSVRDPQGKSTMHNKLYNKIRNPFQTRLDSARGFLLQLLNKRGPLSLIDIWKIYVVEFKQEKIEDHEPIWDSLSIRGPRYYQAVSARLTDLDVAGLVGRVGGVKGSGWDITEKGREILSKGFDKIKLQWQDVAENEDEEDTPSTDTHLLYNMIWSMFSYNGSIDWDYLPDDATDENVTRLKPLADELYNKFCEEIEQRTSQNPTLQWQDLGDEFQKGVKVRFRNTAPKENRTFSDRAGDDYTIGFDTIGIVSEIPNLDYDDVCVFFPQDKRIPCVCYREDLEVIND